MIGTQPGELMRSEIAEQPECWAELATTQADSIRVAARLLAAPSTRLLVFAARGSSDHAAQYGQYLAHTTMRLPAMLATPASITIDGAHLRYPGAVMIAVSQSGESPDLLATVADAKLGGTPVIALTNNPSSQLAAMADVHVNLSAGPENSVAATKTYTAELLALLLILTKASAAPDIDLHALCHDARALLAVADKNVGQWGRDLGAGQRLLLVGRGTSMSSAKEGALKLMETCAVAASGWSAADATHGPLAQVVNGTPVITFAAGSGRNSVTAFASLAAANGAKVISVLEGIPDAVATWGAGVVSRPSPALAPLLEILPMQRVALELALQRGLNPDAPAGLRKVTLTH